MKNYLAMVAAGGALFGVMLGACEERPAPIGAASSSAAGSDGGAGAAQGAASGSPANEGRGATAEGGTTGGAAEGQPAAESERLITVLNVVFEAPAGWEERPPANPMRAAELHIPGPGGDPAKACLVTFSTAGGDVKMNIDRWAGQVLNADGKPATPEIQTRTIAGLPVHTVEMSGTYVGMGQTPNPDWTMRGAVIETSRGLVFVKMTGPADAMAAAKPAYEAMIDGLKVK